MLARRRDSLQKSSATKDEVGWMALRERRGGEWKKWGEEE
jgi:hypothetical protein